MRIIAAVLMALCGAGHAGEIAQFDPTSPKTDDTRVVGIDCDNKTKTLEVGYFTSYNLPSKRIELWNTLDLKTNGAPDERGNAYVIAVHEVVRNCSLGNIHYVVKITAVPGNRSLNGECGGLTYGRAKITRNGVTIFDDDFERCMSKTIVAKVRMNKGRTKPIITKLTRRQNYGYE